MNKRTIAKIVLGIGFTMESLRILISGGITIAQGLPEIIPATSSFEADEAKKEKGTILYVYGYYGPGHSEKELEELSKLGLNHWMGLSGVEDANSDQNFATVLTGLSKISVSDQQKYGLTELSSLEVPMFWQREKLVDESTITYVTTSPDQLDVTPISNAETKIYLIINDSETEARLASVDEANNVKSGGMPGWHFGGLYTRSKAMLYGDKIRNATWEEEKKNKSCELTDKYIAEIRQISALYNARASIELNQGTKMYAYGRETLGEMAGSDYSRVPEGTMLWSAWASIDSGNPSAGKSQTLFLSFTPLSEEEQKANGLVFLSDKYVAGFFIEGKTANEGGPYYYFSPSPNGSSGKEKPFSPLVISSDSRQGANDGGPTRGDRVDLYLVKENETGEIIVCSFSEALYMIMGQYNSKTYTFLDVCNEQAMAKYGIGCSRSTAITGYGDTDGYYDVLTAAVAAQAQVPGR